MILSFFCKTILSVAWICAWFGSADYFKICGEHCNQLLDCYSVLHMSPHAGKGNKHLSHWINSGKREGRGGENCLDKELPLQTMIKVHAQSTSKNASNAEYVEFQHAYMQKTLDYYGMLMLLTLLNCIWLHIRFIISANSIL